MDNTSAIIITIVSLIILSAYLFMKMSKEEQIEKVRGWLLYAVCEAERQLGTKTGKLKLRMCYGMFVEKFGWIAKIISFDEFSLLVDEALEEMKVLVETNEAVKEFIDG